MHAGRLFGGQKCVVMMRVRLRLVHCPSKIRVASRCTLQFGRRIEHLHEHFPLRRVAAARNLWQLPLL